MAGATQRWNSFDDAAVVWLQEDRKRFYGEDRKELMCATFTTTKKDAFT
jgi:hypothetical protein